MEKANLVKIAHKEKIQIEAAGNDLVPRIQAEEFEKNLVVEDDIEEGAVHHVQPAVILNETQFAELIQEKAHPGTGGADHVGQRFLTDFRNHRLRLSLFPKMGH